MGEYPASRATSLLMSEAARDAVPVRLRRAAGLAQFSYAIGVAKPRSLFVKTYGTENGTRDADDVTNLIKVEFIFGGPQGLCSSRTPSALLRRGLTS